MVKLKEVGIFPKLCESGHSFVPFIENTEDRNPGFYKRDARDKADSSKVYATLYCTKCGNTKEIVIVNRRK